MLHQIFSWGEMRHNFFDSRALRHLRPSGHDCLWPPHGCIRQQFPQRRAPLAADVTSEWIPQCSADNATASKTSPLDQASLHALNENRHLEGSYTALRASHTDSMHTKACTSFLRERTNHLAPGTNASIGDSQSNVMHTGCRRGCPCLCSNVPEWCRTS